VTEQSFKSVLADCRRIVEGEKDDRWRDFTLEVLDRWIDEPDADKAWNTILKSAKTGGRLPLSPFPLIEWVIDQAIEQKRLRDEIIPRSKQLEERAISLGQRSWRAGLREENAELIDAAHKKATFALQYRQRRVRVLGRQPNPHKIFIKSCREMFIANCGQPLEPVVELLTSVVMGRPLKPNAVRDALKLTTRKGRDTRGKK
jgi:hypothetical protein